MGLHSRALGLTMDDRLHCQAQVGPLGIPATRFLATGCGPVTLAPSGESAMAYNFGTEPVPPHASVIVKRCGTEHQFWLVKAVS